MQKQYFRPRVGLGWFPVACQQLHLRIFVPEWGWVGSLMLRHSMETMLKTNFRPRVGMGWFHTLEFKCRYRNIFVPEWGWVGSTIAGICALKNKQFSSPLGDGLVPRPLMRHHCTNYFRPRVGMGWFIDGSQIRVAQANFRPRVGMGWFICKNGSITLPKRIFVPAWGWVGSRG